MSEAVRKLWVPIWTCIPIAAAATWFGMQALPSSFTGNDRLKPVDCAEFAASTEKSYFCAYFSTAMNHAESVGEGHAPTAKINTAKINTATIELPVVLATATPGVIADTAVLVAGGGGPGNSLGMGLEGFTFDAMLAGLDVFHEAGMDIVLVDQRGVGMSRPRMTCPPLGQMYRELFSADLGLAEENQRFEEVLGGCRQRLLDQQVPVERLDTRDSAADFLDLMEQLPYRHWIVLGVSYGAQVAYEMAVQRPDAIAALVLDSLPGLASEDHFMIEADAKNAVTHILDLCLADTVCAYRYPGLHYHFDYLLKRYQRQAEVWTMLDGGTLVMNDDRFLSMLFQAVYWPENIAYLPYAIHSAAYENDTEPLSRLAEDYYNWMTNTEYGDVLNTNILCELNYPLQQRRLQAQPALRRAWSRNDEIAWNSQHSLCAMWEADVDTERFDQPVVVQVPTLILSGGLDPVTPPAAARAMRQWLPRSRFVLDPNHAHAILFSSDCAHIEVGRFLHQYERPLHEDVDCRAGKFSFFH